MTDIVERLRAPAYWMSGSSEGHEGENSAPLDAADEIERLRAALSTARADALEEAAMRCDTEANSELYPAPGGFTDPREEAHKKTARRIAAAIRALIKVEGA